MATIFRPTLYVHSYITTTANGLRDQFLSFPLVTADFKISSGYGWYKENKINFHPNLYQYNYIITSLHYYIITLLRYKIITLLRYYITSNGFQ